MRSFYDMMQLLEAEQVQGLGDESGDKAPAGAPQTPNMGDAPEAPNTDDTPQAGGNEGPEHYMFFANLKVIKNRVEEMLAMDVSKVDALLGDGHDWACDHISTSRDDVEEVYNWLSGEMGGEAPSPEVKPETPEDGQPQA